MTALPKLPLVALTLLALLCGCGDGPQNPDPPRASFPEDLVGAWEFESGSVNGVTTAICSPAFMNCEDGTRVARIQFRADYSMTYRERADNGDTLRRLDGNVAVSGTRITMTFDTFNGEAMAPLVYRGNYEVLVPEQANRYDWIDEDGNRIEVWTSR